MDTRLRPGAAGLRRAREVGDKRAENRGQRPEVRGQKSEFIDQSNRPVRAHAHAHAHARARDRARARARDRDSFGKRSTPNAERPIEEDLATDY